VIAEDRIETVGAGIDAVTDHMIVMVVTSSSSQLIDACSKVCFAPFLGGEPQGH